MASVRPYRALRPISAEVAPRIASVPYDVVSTAEARALADGNPLSFLHVSRAEIDLPPETNPHADQVYARASANFNELRSSLVQEAEPAVYFYRLRMGAHTQTGLAACFSIREYESDIIKKHEKTRRDKEDDRTRHIIDLRAQTGLVFLTYRKSDAVDELAAVACSGTPLYDFTAPDGVVHTIWRADPATSQRIVDAMNDVPVLYIADGHHRAASAARAHERLRATAAQDDEHAWFVAVAFPDDQVHILPYHRAVKDLSGRSPQTFLDQVKARFPIAPGSPAPSRPGECAMFLDGQWHRITLVDGVRPGGDPTRSLDVSVLQERLIEPLLDIHDVRSDTRIDFVGGIRGPGELERLVREGRDAVAFAMYPVTVTDLMAVADAGSIMPPKSTWFEPKLRDGLLTHLI